VDGLPSGKHIDVEADGEISVVQRLWHRRSERLRVVVWWEEGGATGDE